MPKEADQNEQAVEIERLRRVVEEQRKQLDELGKSAARLRDQVERLTKGSRNPPVKE